MHLNVPLIVHHACSCCSRISAPVAFACPRKSIVLRFLDADFLWTAAPPMSPLVQGALLQVPVQLAAFPIDTFKTRLQIPFGAPGAYQGSPRAVRALPPQPHPRPLVRALEIAGCRSLLPNAGCQYHGLFSNVGCQYQGLFSQECTPGMRPLLTNEAHAVSLDQFSLNPKP